MSGPGAGPQQSPTFITQVCDPSNVDYDDPNVLGTNVRISKTQTANSLTASIDLANSVANRNQVNSYSGIDVYVRGPAGTAVQYTYSVSGSVSAGNSSVLLAGATSVLGLAVTGLEAGESGSDSDSDGGTVDTVSSGGSFTCFGENYQWVTSFGFPSSTSVYDPGVPYGSGHAEANASVSFSGHIVRPDQQTPTAVITDISPTVINAPVLLDGTGSSDQDGVIVEYQWRVQNSSGGTDVFRGAAFPYAQIPYTWTAPGTYQVQLTVTDDDGLTGIATTLVSVTTVTPDDDEDDDDVPDNRDECPGTPAGESVDSRGCSDSQRDSDGDDITDDRDLCDTTPIGATPNSQGCMPVEIRFDLNRDGLVQFDYLADSPTSGVPFRFWTNNDHDGFSFEDNELTDIEPVPGSRGDASEPEVRNLRDLEDLAQVAMRLPIDFDATSDGWSVSVTFESALSTPLANLYEGGDWPYLRDAHVDQGLLSRPSVALLSPAGSSLHPSLFLAGPARFIFEGVTEGCGQIRVRLSRAGVEVSEGSAELCLHSITAFYDHWTAGDDTGMNTRPLRQVPGAPPVTYDQSEGLPDYILFVHGWRMQPWERRAFAETAFKRLWHSGFRGRLGLFSWPTGWVPRPGPRNWARYVRENYDISEMAAWHAGTQLRHLMSQLWGNPSYRSLQLVAHSMGNVVASEALRIEAMAGASRQLVQTYVASQAAIAASAYHPGVQDEYSRYPVTGQPYFGLIGRSASTIVNFANPLDFALYFGWRVNNESKPDQGCVVNWANGRSAMDAYRRRGRVLRFGQDTYEIFSFCARSGSPWDIAKPALGAELDVAGMGSVIDYTVNLRDAFGFTLRPADHSAQFGDTIHRRRPYWAVLLSTMGIPVN